MTDVIPEQQAVDLDKLVGEASVGTDELDAVDEQLIARLAGRARAGGLQLTGVGGLLAQLTKRLSSPPWRARSPTTSATTAMTRPVATAGTRATGTAQRPC